MLSARISQFGGHHADISGLTRSRQYDSAHILINEVKGSDCCSPGIAIEELTKALSMEPVVDASQICQYFAKL